MGLFVIWWGKKAIRLPQGYAADFCPICRDITPVRIYHHSLVSHVYSIGYGKGGTYSHTAKCLACKTLLPTDLKRYSSISDFSDTLPSLIRRTHAHIYRSMEDRLEIEKRLKAQPQRLAPDLTHSLIVEKLLAVETEVAQRLHGPRFDVACAAVIVGYFFTLAMLSRYLGPLHLPASIAPALAPLLTWAAILLLAWLYFTAYARFANGVYPRLGRAMAPFNPSEPELARAIKSLGQYRLGVARMLKAHKLRRAVKKYR